MDAPGLSLRREGRRILSALETGSSGAARRAGARRGNNAGLVRCGKARHPSVSAIRRTHMFGLGEKVVRRKVRRNPRDYMAAGVMMFAGIGVLALSLVRMWKTPADAEHVF